jgi:hypothetical protein
MGDRVNHFKISTEVCVTSAKSGFDRVSTLLCARDEDAATGNKCAQDDNLMLSRE